MMSVFSRAGAGIQNILSEWRQPASLPAGPACVSAAFSSDANRAIPSPALLPAATGSHPSGRSSEKLPPRRPACIAA